MRQILSYLFLLIAAASFASNNSKLIEGNGYYSNERYDDAIAAYESLLETDESAAAYFNLGNAYYKKGEIAGAILNYERAALLDPNDADIKSNLELAKLQTVDKIDTVEPFAISEWIDGFLNLHSSNTWAKLCILFFILALGCASIYLFMKGLSLRRIGFFGINIFALAFIICFFSARAQKQKLTAHDHAIIFTPSVTVKASPEDNAKDYFLLHAGTKVKVKQTMRDKWMEIELEDGNVGWIHTSDAKVI